MKHERCLSFSFGHCVVCSSSRSGLWLPLWCLQTILKTFNHIRFVCLFVVMGFFFFFSLICSIDQFFLSWFNTFCAVMVGVLVSSWGFRGIELRSDETQHYAIDIFCFFANHTSLRSTCISIKCTSSLTRALYLTRQQ